MKKLSVFIFLSITFSCISYAQVKEGLTFKIGGGYNFSNGYLMDGGPNKMSGPGGFFEITEYLDSGISAGGQINYKYGKGITGETELYPGLDATSHLVGLKGLVDYNFCPESVVNPYAGIGLGIGYMHISRKDNAYMNHFYWTLVPRVGVQIWHFQLSVEWELFLFNNRNYSSYRGSSSYCFASSLGLNLGIVF